MQNVFPVCIIGAGLAGSECAYQLAKRGIDVVLIEMRPKKFSPAHHSESAAELVCSNSLRSNDVTNAVGLLKEEMAALDSLIIRAAYKTQVPAGTALAVDREGFARFVSAQVYDSPHIKVIHDVVTSLRHCEAQGAEAISLKSIIEIHLESGQKILSKKVVIASGPLTDEKLSQWILKTTGQDALYFYDSIAPIVAKDSIDMTKAFRGSRYDQDASDDGDYINCPMTKDEYYQFIEAIQTAELTEVKDFDKAQFFEGCLPIEEMARRGKDTLIFGPMKPVGLGGAYDSQRLIRPLADNTPLQNLDPRFPYAVVQLRQDNAHETLYNMVGFQTRMKWPEQKRIFSTIPGLEKAEFVRLGAMHRNTYICSPLILREGMEHKNFAGVHFAGQITGCEGYVESAAVGLYVGLHLSEQILQKNLSPPPQTTALGALINHILKADPNNYQPMNINFGLFPDIEVRMKKFDKKIHILKRAFADFRQWFYKMDGV